MRVAHQALCAQHGVAVAHVPMPRIAFAPRAAPMSQCAWIRKGTIIHRVPPLRRRAVTPVAATPTPSTPQPPEQDVPSTQTGPASEDGDLLLPEEDVEVPGTYLDAMNSNTKLGKAVRAAVDELEHLGELEADVLQQCDGLLRKLGMRGSIFGTAVNGQASNNSPGTLDTSSSSSSGGGDVVNSQGGGEGSQS